MRISRRTSGGRGEYEISENFGDAITPTDLLDSSISIDFGGGWVVETGTILRSQGGKRRLRLLPEVEIHLHRQLAAALLMPAAVRADNALGRGHPVMKADRYAIEHIDLRNVQLTRPANVPGARVRMELGEITLRNENLHAETLDPVRRLRELQVLWDRAGDLPRPIAALLMQHRALVTAGSPIPEQAERIVEELQDTLTVAAADFGILYRNAGQDALPDLLQTLEWAGTEARPEPPVRVDDVDPDETEIRLRIIREWKRWASARGAASARFRQAVREAYTSTCVVCGAYLPATRFNRIPGVDAAHILPWAQFDLDEVCNGLCVCKFHHWAFDEGLLVVRWDGARYQIEVPDQVQAGIAAEYPGFAIDRLLRYAGPIDEERLPRDLRNRPNPNFLQRLNESE